MIDFISQPWPWYVAGPLIGFNMFLLIYLGKTFGVSSTLRTMCSVMGAGKRVAFFDFDWKAQLWNIVFVSGGIIGGAIAALYLDGTAPVILSEATQTSLSALGFSSVDGLAPDQLFSTSALTDPKSLSLLIIGGLLIGFGTRWAGGCTSGHAITGLSNLQLPSLIAVIGFFIGGLVMTHLLYPIIF